MESLTNLDARADAIARALARRIDRDELVGAVVALTDSESTAFRAVGHADRESKTLMRPDTIVRIHSMSKPLMVAAFLGFAESARLSLDEPVHTFLPELTRHEIRLEHLLTHTSGLPYANPEGTAAERRMAEATGDLCGDMTLALGEWAARLADAELAHPPGEAWMYGIGMDLLGRVAEVASGLSLDAFLEKHLFEPLGMQDTGFGVSAASHARVATMYRPTMHAIDASLDAPTFLSGGGGLFSTAADYVRFCHMLLHGGARVLSRSSAVAMCSDQLLRGGVRIAPFGPVSFGAGCSFGLGGRVVVDPSASGYGAVSTYGWDGIGGTTFFVDVASKLACVLVTQMIPWPRGLHEETRALACASRST